LVIGKRKRWTIAGFVLMAALVLGAPFIAIAIVILIPGMAQEKFISSADGSTGPAFSLCLWIWGGVTVFGFITGSVPIVLGALRRDD
jgi:hypothetical protein